MRNKVIIFSCFIVCLCLVILVPTMNLSLSQYKEYKVLKEQVATLSEAQKGANKAGTEKTYEYNKRDVTDSISAQDGCEIVKVSALLLDGTNTCTQIASSENLDAVYNFGNEANCIEYVVHAEYPSQFLDFLEGQGYVIDSLSYNLQSNEITTRILFLNGGVSTE